MASIEGVDQDRVKTVVGGYYVQGDWHGMPYGSYLGKVVARVTKLANNYVMPYQEPRFADALEERDICVTAAWMHELTERFAYSFESLTDLGGYRVAEVVTQISPDIRLPVSKRHDERLLRLQQSNWKGQVVELAVLLTQLDVVRSEPWAAMCGSRFAEIRSWIQQADKRLAAIIRLTDQAILKPYFKEAKNKLQAIQEDGRLAAGQLRTDGRYNTGKESDPFKPSAR